MFYSTLAALTVASGAFAFPGITAPGPSDAFTAEGQCAIAWTADTNTTFPWKAMNIELMTGINSQMTHMRTIGTVDATTQTTFTWVCPDVDLNAPAYFYQFSDSIDPTNLIWTGRWTIKATDGSSTTDPLTDPNGVAYGIGHFTDPSLYNAAPAYLAGNGQLQGGPANGTTTTSPSSGSPASTTGTSTGTGSGTVATSTGTSTGTITKVTSSSTNTASSKPSTTSTTSTGGAVALSSSSWMSLISGALMAGVVALSI